ncbi:MAG: flagellar biosynthesis protein FliQ [candidate division Zixibacteria bacterium]|nr:flagellar biosynthesis protein FliQ [candidate division Zixibacteria bacterium]
MTPQYVIALGKEAILLTLTVSAPMLILGLIVGLVIAIFQAVTQIHEMTLTFVPKIIAVGLALLVFFPWIINLLVGFTTRLFEQIPTLVG